MNTTEDEKYHRRMQAQSPKEETICDFADYPKKVEQKQSSSAPPNPLDVQVGGEHYKGMKIQPVEFITANNLGFLEGCIIKRICRWRAKDGLKDLEKIKHEVDLLIEMEKRK